MSRLSLSYLFLSSAAVLLVTAAEASAQSCAEAPSCSELGYTKSVSQCSGKTILYCPFDSTKVFCQDEVPISCASLGFTDTVSACKGEYVLCPSDATKGKCINGPQVGDIKYSQKSSNHNGWLLCNGTQYSTTTYSKLYNVIGTKFCSVISAGSCSSGKFAVPDYRGYFLRGYGSPSLSSSYSSYYGSYNYSTSSPQKEQLPNLSGWFGFHTKSTVDGTLFSRSSTGGTEGIRNGDTTSNRAIFNASKYNSIYNGSHVVPGNYGVYIFIYAGQ
ncbi:MAG: tail fiber protein [Alphaproteobacteria bacterium]|nr:tail fiber protein [Alphaproteobacteria bacterium]